MLPGHSPTIVLFLAATSLLAGCAQPGPVLSRRTTLGTLKTSLSHLEFENQQLRGQVSKLEAENREIENRLVQEEEVNGDLTARLDDARDLLSRQGYEWGDPKGSMTRDEPAGGTSPSRTLPAARSNRKPRKPPFARIPARVEAVPPARDLDDELTHPRIPSTDAFGPQSWQDDDVRWLPIARGSDGSASKVR